MKRRARPLLRKGVLIMAPFVAAALLLAPTLLPRRSEFRFVVRTSHVAFVVGDLQARGIFNALPLSKLSVEAARSVVVHDLEAIVEPAPAPATTFRPAQALETARIDVAGGLVAFDDVRLHTAPLRPGRAVTLRWDESEPARLGMTLAAAGDGDDTTVVEMNHHVRFTCSGCSIQVAGGEHRLAAAGTLTFSERRLAQVRSGGETDTDIGLWAATGEGLTESDIPLMESSRLDFVQVDGSFVSSSIRGDENTLSFPELERSVAIRDGAFVMLDGVTDGLIRRVRVEDGILLVVTGRIAGGLRTGTAYTSLSPAAPTWAEYLVFGRGWTAYWGLVVMTGTAVLAVLTRLKLVSG